MSLQSLTRALHRWLTRHPFSWRRLGFLGLALAGFSGLLALVRVSQALDALLFPGYRQQPVTAPVFVIATPRSGSTFLHRLLCLDEERFAYFKTYQTLLPAVSLYRALGALGRGKEHLPRRLFRTLVRSTGNVWENIHTVRLQQAEEDEALFLLARHTPAIYMLFPHVDALPELRCLDGLSSRRRRALMADYRRALQRFLFVYGEERTYLAKNVFACTRLRSLVETFPDARFVFLVRHPYEGVPSLLSLFYAVWEIHSPAIPPYGDEIQQLVEVAYDQYRHLTATIPAVPEAQKVCLRYEELVADPGRAVATLYDHFGWEMSPAFCERLQEVVRASRDYESEHDYSLAGYGLDKESVYEALSPEFAAHGYEP